MHLIVLHRLRKFKDIRKDMGLKRTWQQAHTPQTIRKTMVEMRQVYLNAGAREMISLLFHEKGMAVSRYVSRSLLFIY